jgi:hypothetical protein
LSQIHSSGTSSFTLPESIRRSGPQPGVDLPHRVHVPGYLGSHVFENEAAHQARGNSAAVKKFKAAYGSELVEGDVVFTDYEVIADIRK